MNNFNNRRVKRRRGARHTQWMRPLQPPEPRRPQPRVGASAAQWASVANAPRESALGRAMMRAQQEATDDAG